MSKHVAVIWFPGMNCEHESVRALEAVGISARIVRWNEPMGDFAGYLLPGGWSFEDRIRAGVVSSKDPLLDHLRKEAMAGKPILGICNGCQILIESGIIPNMQTTSAMALAPNDNPLVDGFYCTWIHVKNTSTHCVFTKHMAAGEAVLMPIAHGEGRFICDDATLAGLKKKGQIALTYCDASGEDAIAFPQNPNGSIAAIAGVTNEAGNVLAMMPHPERGMFAYQQQWNRRATDAFALTAAASIFKAMRDAL